MNLPALTRRYAQSAPHRTHAAFALLLMALLYWLSSVPGTPLPEHPGLFEWVPPSVQNALHVPAYAVLSWAWWWALGGWLPKQAARTLAASAIASAYGVLDE